MVEFDPSAAKSYKDMADVQINLNLFSADALNALQFANAERTNTETGEVRSYVTTGDIFIGLLRLPRDNGAPSSVFLERLWGTQEEQVEYARWLQAGWNSTLKDQGTEATIVDLQTKATVARAIRIGLRDGRTPNALHLMLAVMASEEQSGTALFYELTDKPLWENDPVDKVIFDPAAQSHKKRRAIAGLFGVKQDILIVENSQLHAEAVGQEVILGHPSEAPVTPEGRTLDEKAAIQIALSRIRAIMNAQDINERDLAGRTKIGLQTIERLFSGSEVKPRGKTWVKLASGLRVPLSDILPEYYRMYS